MRTTRFTVAMSRPGTHLYEITMEVDPAGATSLDIALPVWTPGSYLVREFSRHVRDFSAKTRSGRSLDVEKISKNTWRVSFPPPLKESLSSLFFIRYRVYAHELSVRTSHLDSSHGYGNGANLFFYVEGRKDEPQELEFRLPRGWKTSMALPARGGIFRAADYDELVDSPFECGTHQTISFRVLGVLHSLAIWGDAGEDAVRLVRDLKKLVREVAGLFGGLPYERYMFLVHLASGARGGLEHRASQSVALDIHALRPGKAYREALALFAHELFHAWNVKRIRPEEFGPFDYDREVYTNDLWALEGITSYYETLLTVRAGLVSEAEALGAVAAQWKGFLETPGREVQSVEAASFDTWIRFYRPDENSTNVSESYYRRGALLGLALDLLLRDATVGRRGLDDVLRFLFRTYAAKGRPYSDGAIESAACRVAGGASGRVRSFFTRCVRGTSTPDLQRLLRAAGLRLREAPEIEDPPRRQPRRRATFSWKTKTESGTVSVLEVLSGGAAERGGIDPGDVLVALDGLRATEEEVARVERELAPARKVDVVLFRRDVLQTRRVTLGSRRATVWKIEPSPEVTPALRRLKKRWLASLGG